MVFTPVAKGIFAMVHAVAEPVAMPEIATEDDAVDHITEIAPGPPDAAPDRLIVPSAVVAAVALTERVSGATAGDVGVGVGVGAGTTGPGCAAYRVCIAAMSSAVNPETCL